ncbi:MAG: hypothetical protein N2643_04065 [Endomicrobia bacterium]|nr:hypothetical protein [Endomicrobiia bacterium]
MKKYFLGIDIGGTKTDVALTDVEGNLIFHFKERGANYQVNGIRRLQSVLNTIRKKTEIKCGPLSNVSVVFGISGLDTKKDETIIKERIKIAGFSNYTMMNDALIALKAGLLDEKYGIVVVCGTGNILYGFGPKGVSRIGGLGYVLGDIFSGPDIGKAVLARMFDYWWCGKTEEIKVFAKEVMNYFGVNSVEELKFYIFDNIDSVYKKIGYLVIPIVRSYKKGDKFVKNFIDEVAKNFSNKIIALSKRVGLSSNIKVVLSGGVFFHSDSIIEKSMCKMLPRNFQCFTLNYKPVLGALLFAYENEKLIKDSTIKKLLPHFKNHN